MDRSVVSAQITLIWATADLFNAILRPRRTTSLWPAFSGLGSGSCGAVGPAKSRRRHHVVRTLGTADSRDSREAA